MISPRIKSRERRRGGRPGAAVVFTELGGAGALDVVADAIIKKVFVGVRDLRANSRDWNRN